MTHTQQPASIIFTKPVAKRATALNQDPAADELIYRAVTTAILTVYAYSERVKALAESTWSSEVIQVWIYVPSMDAYMHFQLNARPGTLIRLATKSLIQSAGVYPSPKQVDALRRDLVRTFECLDGTRRQVLRAAYQRYLALKD